MTMTSPAFIQHIQSQVDNDFDMEAFLAACDRPLRKSIRVNTLKISVEDFKTRAEQLDWQLTPIPWCNEGFWIVRSKEQEDTQSLGNFVEHLQGLFYIQEASSMLPPVALMSQCDEPHLLLDMAAAPGSKTTQLAAYMNNEGTLIANELSSSRLKALHANVQRCGVKNVCLTHMDGSLLGDRLKETFSAILLDAPCGGEGTLRKDPNALNNWSLQALEDISEIQKKLISSAYEALAPGGTLIYSTCTLSREENQDVCDYLLEHYQDMTIQPLTNLFAGANECTTPEGYLHVFPHIYDSEGFFVAAFRKQGELSADQYQTPAPTKWPYTPISRKNFQQVTEYYLKHFGIDFSDQKNHLWQKDKEVWLFPDATTQIATPIKLNRSGFKLCELHKQQTRSSHDFAIVFGGHATSNVAELSAEDTREYLQGRNLENALEQNGEVIVRYKDKPLGLVKAQKNNLKNNLLRSLVSHNPIA
ncbi:16S rRNA (cytosine(1407)-C(5))-methyltransferase RsmF [Pleionea sp. CnH1-48]|uniref:16S rRNA (cytosine(1407)-C(5))-methyltransferase RsmF n=1 Tax=Pleionea sp. CnH1-48 TaxID=2954494 RepID=UPI002096C14A|nr:16S rRNA (cytosine(1407)-C(5))-methyltransferase RsmF [Pleionea sp. CnH1-48]MCO7225630.1 16S rRNA (cytosine(1407)-C(5))-methyltransferase RsmF [Pleionea sp. CnH1-48]